MPRAVAYFFFARADAGGRTCSAGRSCSSPVGARRRDDWLMIGVAGIIGYIGPSLYIDRRIKVRRYEHQAGFPDFMDLLVVCADAGLSMEAVARPRRPRARPIPIRR